MKLKLLVAALLICAGTATAAVETITGEVLDLFCYATRDAKGKEHSQCASSCIKANVPVAVLTADGVLYYPLRADHKPANPLFENLGGEKVTVSGTVYEKHGSKFIVVNEVQKAK